MHFVPEELSAAYIALRCQVCDAPRPLSWADHIRICMPRAKLSAPAKAEDIALAEEALGIHFPTELRELLLETNGVDGLYSTPVCPLDRIVAMNREFRSADYLADRMPFNHLLFFGDTGNGDDFAFPISRNGAVGSPVFMWEHESDCRQEYASGLSDFLVHYAVQFYAIGANEQTA